MGLGALSALLIRKLVPGADEDTVADIMEEILPTPDDMPLHVDPEELEGVLQGDAQVFADRQRAAEELLPEPAAQEEEIAAEVRKLRAQAHKRKGEASAAAAAAAHRLRQAPLPATSMPEAKCHWQGKGLTRWTREEPWSN